MRLLFPDFIFAIIMPFSKTYSQNLLLPSTLVSIHQPGLHEVANTKVRDVLEFLRLPIPDHLDKLVLSVSDGNTHLSYNAVRALCGLIYGKGTLFENNTGKAKQVGTRRNYLEHGHITEDEAVLSFMRALEEHRKKCEKEGKYMEARTASKRLHDLKVKEYAL